MLLPTMALFSLTRNWQPFEPFVQLNDARLTESSGIAPSRTKVGSYYTHNDSGDGPRFFRFSRTGMEGQYTLKAASAVDWEDVATARVGGKNWIYLADVGDNAEKRPSIVVYRVEEPKSSGGEIRSYETWTLQYPDKPHNCEAVMVAPESGDLYVVTKAETRSTVFVLKAPHASKHRTFTKIGEISPNTGLGKYGRLVTGGDIAPDGKHVVLRTYSGLLEYRVKGHLDNWWKSSPQLLPAPIEAQGEAACYALSGKHLLTTSEGSPCPVQVSTLKK